MPGTLEEWLKEPHKSGWVDGAGTTEAAARLEIHDPATETVIATVPDSSAEAVGHAVASAVRAFRTGPWRAMSPAEREARLHGLANRLESDAGELQKLIVLENGKLLSGAQREAPLYVVRTRLYCSCFKGLLELPGREPGLIRPAGHLSPCEGRRDSGQGLGTETRPEPLTETQSRGFFRK